MCAQAYKCDRCTDFGEGTPEKVIGIAATASGAQSRTDSPDDPNLELCPDCWTSFVAWREMELLLGGSDE